jgi:hypothetical protein
MTKKTKKNELSVKLGTEGKCTSTASIKKREQFIVVFDGASGTGKSLYTEAERHSLQEMIDKHEEIRLLKAKANAYEKVLLHVFEGMNSDVEWHRHAMIHDVLKKYCTKKIKY